MDLTDFGFRQQNLASVVGHAGNIAGEISALKGLLGLKGHPF